MVKLSSSQGRPATDALLPIGPHRDVLRTSGCFLWTLSGLNLLLNFHYIAKVFLRKVKRNFDPKALPSYNNRDDILSEQENLRKV